MSTRSVGPLHACGEISDHAVTSDGSPHTAPCLARRVVPVPMLGSVEGHPEEREEWILVLVAEQLPQPVLLEEQQEETALLL